MFKIFTGRKSERGHLGGGHLGGLESAPAWLTGGRASRHS